RTAERPAPRILTLHSRRGCDGMTPTDQRRSRAQERTVTAQTADLPEPLPALFARADELATLLDAPHGSDEDVPRPEHPRPQLQRPAWRNLNGTWQFEIDQGD